MVIEMTSSRDMARVICEIPFKLPSLNEYIRACRTNPFMAAKFKRDVEDSLAPYISLLPVFSRVRIHFHWIEDNKRRDLDNICAAKKFILDALVKYERLSDDNRKCVISFTDTFSYEKKAKVILEITEVKE